MPILSKNNKLLPRRYTVLIQVWLVQLVLVSPKTWEKLMENVVYLQLRRNHQDIYYYKTIQDYEVDFFLPKENTFIQVSQNFDTLEIQERELRAFVSAAQEQKKVMTHLIVTERAKQSIDNEGLHIEVVPLYEWLLR